MTWAACDSPLPFERLVDYTAGDLSAAEEERLEAHYFACARCSRRLAVVEALGVGVGALVRRGAARASVTRDVVERIAREGLTLRHYVLAPGDVVPCTAAPADDFVLVELRPDAGAAAGGARVDVETRVLASGAITRQTLLSSCDPASGSILLLFPAEVIRSFPRSRWTMQLSFEADPAARFGAYVMDHTPWQELAPSGEPAPG